MHLGIHLGQKLHSSLKQLTLKKTRLNRRLWRFGQKALDITHSCQMFLPGADFENTSVKWEPGSWVPRFSSSIEKTDKVLDSQNMKT
jgi:hypothetical protein